MYCVTETRKSTISMSSTEHIGIYVPDTNNPHTAIIGIDEPVECLTIVSGSVMMELCNRGFAKVIDGRFAPLWGMICDQLFTEKEQGDCPTCGAPKDWYNQ